LPRRGALHRVEDAQTVVGSATMTEDGKLVIVTKEAGTITAVRESSSLFARMRDQAAYEVEFNRYRIHD